MKNNSSDMKLQDHSSLFPPDRKQRLFVEIFGCQMNKLDGEIIRETFNRAGFDSAETPEEADVILFLTCAVRQHAEDRFFSRLGSYKQSKSKKPWLKIVVAGCIAEEHGDKILDKYSFVDVICGTRHFAELPKLISQAAGQGPVVATGDNTISYLRRNQLGPIPAKAFISIMRGCSLNCSYCIVPRVRGRERSRPSEEILEEAQELVSKGVKEITLLGQTVNSYGKSLGPDHSLAKLLRKIGTIRGLERLHIVTNHPIFMTDDLIEAIREVPAACEGIHLPAQSGSNIILKRMGRRYSREDYLEIIRKCRDRIPGFEIAGDFIVGFPGETEEDFQLTIDLIQNVNYMNLFIFQYSPRPGTRAADFSDDVPKKKKAERNHKLLDIQRDISLRIYREKIGKEVEVLIEGPSKRNPDKYTGRSRTGKIVIFPHVSSPGEIVKIKIIEATHLALYGEEIPQNKDLKS